MKVKIENQLFFAEVMKLKSEDSLVEHAKWDGYCQGLKYCLCVLSESGMRAEHILTNLPNHEKCICSAEELQPFGECQCGV